MRRSTPCPGLITMRYRFPKTVRIRSSREFSRVFKRGRYAADATLVVNVTPCQASTVSPKPGRIGISIPKKTGNAVVRNRWKRLIREAYRQQRERFPAGYDVVVRPRRGADCDFQAICHSLPRLIRRASGERGTKP